jgi:hypothetical protein
MISGHSLIALIECHTSIIDARNSQKQRAIKAKAKQDRLTIDLND